MGHEVNRSQQYITMTSWVLLRMTMSISQSAAHPTWSLPVRLQWAGLPDIGFLHCLPQLLLLFALLLGNILLLHLTVLQFVLQLHTARLQQAAEGRPALL